MSNAVVWTKPNLPLGTFNGIETLTPCGGNWTFELHHSFLRLYGPYDPIVIQHNNIVSVFVLPKTELLTFVVIALEVPIQRSNKIYQHIVMQFPKFKSSYKGPRLEDFTMALCQMSGIELTRPGSFWSLQDGYAVKSSLKSGHGLLYPLEKSFVFVPNPATLIFHDEIEYVKFRTHTAGANWQYFDLRIRLKTEEDHFFCNITRSECSNLYAFMGIKLIRIEESDEEGRRLFIGEESDEEVRLFTVEESDEEIMLNPSPKRKTHPTCGAADSDEEIMLNPLPKRKTHPTCGAADEEASDEEMEEFLLNCM